MSSRNRWGWGVPLIISACLMVLSFFLKPLNGFKSGIAVGLAVALLQSFLTTWSLCWAWKRTFFYWVWGAGIIARLAVLAGTAYVVSTFARINLVATLLSLVLATTLFLVVEFWIFFNNKNGFSTST